MTSLGKCKAMLCWLIDFTCYACIVFACDFEYLIITVHMIVVKMVTKMLVVWAFLCIFAWMNMNTEMKTNKRVISKAEKEILLLSMLASFRIEGIDIPREKADVIMKHAEERLQKVTL